MILTPAFDLLLRPQPFLGQTDGLPMMAASESVENDITTRNTQIKQMKLGAIIVGSVSFFAFPCGFYSADINRQLPKRMTISQQRVRTSVLNKLESS